LHAEFDLRVVAYDRYKIEHLMVELQQIDASFPMPFEPFGQGFVSMGPAVANLAELAQTGRIRHGMNPVLNAAVMGAVTSFPMRPAP
jgi:phage terminase large subunit-like protein